MKTKLKKVTYNGLIYTVEEKSKVMQWYKLSGIGWIRKEDCAHWLSGWFYKFFQGKWSKLFKN